jgi:hypothetical protein
LSLLVATQGLLERTYDAGAGVEDLGRFIIGDQGYRRLSRRHAVSEVVGEPWHVQVGASGGQDRPRVLVRRRRQGGAALCIYFPDDLIARLESRPPAAVLDEQNVDDFADFVEEIDHFLVLYNGLKDGHELHLLALETRANVSKALVISHFLGRLAGNGRLDATQRRWVRYHLFNKKRYTDPDPRLRRRYRDARRFAVRLLDRLESLPARARVRELRRWNSLTSQTKVRELDSV